MSAVAERLVSAWGESAARHLLDTTRCPVCQGMLAGGCCARCGADLRGPAAIEVWEASVTAADALRARDELLRRVPIVSVPVMIPGPQPAPAPGVGVVPPGQMPPSAVTGVSPDAHRSATLQSVLATAGAGLFAVAAIVFTYFNPDLADKALRSVIVGLITLLFLGGAWLLSRRGLRSSAEAVGGLGLVFAGLDVHAVAQLAAPEIRPWFTAAIITAVAASVMLAAGRASGIRIWQGSAVVALSLVPAMLGIAAATPLGGALGAIGVAFAGAAIGEWLRPPRAELIALTTVQLVASLSALVLVWRAGDGDVTAGLLTVSGLLLLVCVHAVIAARRMLAPLWAYGAGGTGAVAVTLAAYALGLAALGDLSWLIGTTATAAAAAVVLLGAVMPLPRAVPRGILAAGALTVLAAPALMLVGYAGLTGALTLGRFLRQGPELEPLPGALGWSILLGFAGMIAGLTLFAFLAQRRDGMRALTVLASRHALLFAGVGVLFLGCAGLLVLPASVVVLVIAAILVAAVLRFRPGYAIASGARAILLVTGHGALLVSVMVAWRDSAAVPLAGAATLIGLAVLAAARPVGHRFLYTAIGFSYALVLVATALGEVGVGGAAQLCLTASVGLAVAIVVTFLPRIGARVRQAVLVVSTVPFLIGVLQVVVERSGWTALSTGLMFALAVSLLVTRRPGITAVVRTAAAALLVPTLAVMIVCLGAQMLADSASPVTLPIIAVLVALVLPSTGLIRDALVAGSHRETIADAARIAIDVSALVTGAIATGLALWRDAAGLGTGFLVLLILGVGASAAALFAGRRRSWITAGIAFTGALWCLWGIAGVDLLEAYLLPPTLGAATVAVGMTLRGRPARGLYAAGLLVAIAPLLAIAALVEPDPVGRIELPWRIGGLLAAAWLLLGLEALIARGGAGRRVRRLRALRVPSLLAAGLAGTAGTVQGVRIGLGADLPGLEGAALFLVCLGVSATGAAVLALAGRGIRRAAPADSPLRASRLLGAPAALAMAVGVWCAIERDWFSIWAMWTLMLVYLVVMVAAVRETRSTRPPLPPVWILFAIAFVTAVVAWSPRDLRVEWFSLPLGAFLLLAGALGRQGGAETGPGLHGWPGGARGSWTRYAPGLVVMMSASIVSTFTDPLTWRAILVMVLALAAILVGSRGRLAAPFLIGLVVLPIENVFVFSVQIGRGIESMPWWITLATMGAVLLIIAVTAERRTGEGGSVAARLRDLR